MKLKRMVACVLTLLLVVSILPIGAMAEETVNDQDQATLDKNYDKNTGTDVTIPENITVGTNEGLIKSNEGNVVTNEGSVETNEGTVVTNKLMVWTNNDTVKTNERYVALNKGTVETNTSNGEVSYNAGTVETNDGTVKLNSNSGTIETNNGTVGWMDGDDVRSDSGNGGTIETNNGTVLINQGWGTVETNNGTVEENYGTVETNTIDGVVNNYPEAAYAPLANEDAAPSEEVPAVLEGKVVENFGKVVDYTNPEKAPITYYGLSWGDDIQNLTLIDGKVEAGTKGINLGEIANGVTRNGYKMTSYTAYSREEGKDVEIYNIADYEMNAPTWLQIMWQKLGSKSEPKPTRTPVYTKVSGNQVKVGVFVSVNGCIFKIIEVNEDNIRVATVHQLPEKALTDMLGFLKQYLSDAQIAKFQSEPELLEEELVAKFFGGSNEHIAFYASRDLFA